jgi:hypothetical protein
MRAADGTNEEWMERLYLSMDDGTSATATDLTAAAAD